MQKLNTSANIDDADNFYAALLALHEGRTKDESDAINARLILLLSNHIGNRDVLQQAMDFAASSVAAD